MNDIYDHKKELRSSNELHEDFQNQKEIFFLRRRGNHPLSGNLGSSKHDGNSCRLSPPCSKQGILVHKENHSEE